MAYDDVGKLVLIEFKIITNQVNQISDKFSSGQGLKCIII